MGASSVPTDSGSNVFNLILITQPVTLYVAFQLKLLVIFFPPLKMPIVYKNIVTGYLPSSPQHGKDDKTQSVELSETKNTNMTSWDGVKFLFF